jgi:hypothetical protein
MERHTTRRYKPGDGSVPGESYKSSRIRATRCSDKPLPDLMATVFNGGDDYAWRGLSNKNAALLKKKLDELGIE